MSNPTYINKSGEEETKRLNKQSDLIKQASVEHLNKTNLAFAKNVLDMGCGAGSMTIYLAEQIPDGHVYAIDIDEKQIEVARKAVLEKNLTNVTFIQCDITSENPKELNEIMNSIDVVYMRFLLMHLKHPEIAIRNLHKVLKVGGYLASQESILCSTHCEPIDSIDVRLAYSNAIELATRLGVNKNIGLHLQQLYSEEVGFTNPIYYKVTHKIPMSEAAFVLIRSHNNDKALLLEHNITTEADLENYTKVLEDLAEKNNTSLVFDQGYIVVQKAIAN
jgi:ubiquinone/menaquinone biosynthesis C-methylase UbiE